MSHEVPPDHHDVKQPILQGQNVPPNHDGQPQAYVQVNQNDPYRNEPDITPGCCADCCIAIGLSCCVGCAAQCGVM